MRKVILSIFLFLFIGICVFYSYSSNLYGPFVYDDIWQIVDSQDIDSSRYLTSNNWRIITNLSFWLNYNLGSTLEERNAITTIGSHSTFCWHSTNIILHFLCGIVVLLFCRHLGFSWQISLVFSGFFVVHPLASEAVNYIQARSVILLTIFLILSIIYHKNTKLFVLFSLCTIFSKEVGCFYVLAMTILFHRRAISRRVYFLVFWFILLTLLLFPMILERLTSLNLFDNSAQQIFAFWYYVKLFVYPLAQTFSFDHAATNFSVFKLLSGFVTIILTGFFLYKCTEKNAFNLFLASLIILIPYLLIPTKFAIVEYRAYPLLAFFIMILGALSQMFCSWVTLKIHTFYKKPGVVQQKFHVHKKKFMYILAYAALTSIIVLSLLFLSQETRKRSMKWQSAVSIYADAVNKGSARKSIHINLCVSYVATGQLFWRNEQQKIAMSYFLLGEHTINNYMRQVKEISREHMFNLYLQLLKIYEVRKDFTKIISVITRLKKEIPVMSKKHSILMLLEAETYFYQQKYAQSQVILTKLDSFKFTKNLQQRYNNLVRKIQQIQKK
ncbi:tetratricopeptide repeat protein [Candidatus Uabimicrobium sp. HlEnr_7]|uniref:tetratricopeptide repeat protein n=1 Tax=Candidatus Uabimicrobium helgolandensis TaxID=3095367 RepID=UPI003558BB7E